MSRILVIEGRREQAGTVTIVYMLFIDGAWEIRSSLHVGKYLND